MKEGNEGILAEQRCWEESTPFTQFCVYIYEYICACKPPSAGRGPQMEGKEQNQYKRTCAYLVADCVYNEHSVAERDPH